MRQKILFLTVITVFLSIVTVMLVTAGFIFPGRAYQMEPEIETKQNLAEGIPPPNDSRLDLAFPIASEEAQVNLPQDGKLILENNCSQCHQAQTLEETRRSRAEWENILKQMEVFGVQLSVTEKVDLLNYLAGSEK